MAHYPGAVWKPVAAHGGLMSQAIGVVIHVTAGEGDPYNEFANTANQVSSHFGIGNGQGGMADGLVEQYVDTSYKSWAQGAGNTSYLSVETEGMPSDPLTQAQLLAFAGIMAWAYTMYKIPLMVVDTPGQHGLITHGDGGVAWGNHPGCPGPQRSAQRAGICFVASLIVNPPPMPVTVEEYEMADSTVAPNGDIVSHAIGTNNHYLEITRKAGTQGQAATTTNTQIIDMTAAFNNYPLVAG